MNKSGLSSDIFGDNSFEPRTFKKIEKKKLPSSEPESLPLPKKLKPVSSAKIINPSGSSSQDIEVGDRVRHDRFGVGEVIFLDGKSFPKFYEFFHERRVGRRAQIVLS